MLNHKALDDLHCINTQSPLDAIFQTFKILYKNRKLKTILIAGEHISLRITFIFSIFFKNVRTIYIQHCSLNFKKNIIRSFFRLLLYKHIKIIICTSYATLSELNSIGLSNSSIVIYYGLTPKPKRSKIANKIPIILIPSRLEYGKGHVDLFDATHNMGYHILVAGSGSLEDELKFRTRERSDITFMGWVDNMDKLYSECDLVVLPSSSEGFGIVLLEAMAHSLPVICYNFPSSSEIIVNNISGVIIQKGNIIALRESIKNTLNNRTFNDAIGKSALLQVETKFNEDNMQIKIRELLKTIDANY